jgi:hypothetical protein
MMKSDPFIQIKRQNPFPHQRKNNFPFSHFFALPHRANPSASRLHRASSSTVRPPQSSFLRRDSLRRDSILCTFISSISIAHGLLLLRHHRNSSLSLIPSLDLILCSEICRISNIFLEILLFFYVLHPFS